MKLPKLTNLSVTDAADGDAHFPKVEALLPFDGTNGATSTTDSSNSNHTVTFGGDAEISTAQSKFGGSSLSLDGNGDYVDLPQSTNQFVSDDFTIEFWFRINSGAGSETVGLFGSYYTVGGGKGIIMASHPSYPSVYFQWMYGSGSGTDWGYLNKTQGTRTSLSNNTWYHVAVTRSGNTWRLFLNGTQEDSVTQSDQMTDAGSTTRIGNYGPSATATDGLDGYIEDFRITKGLARYTSNFTAPTSANLTSAGDVNKHIVVNSDADGIAIGTGGISQARIAKAWVNFNGTGTVAIRTSYNVSSITDDGTGKYDVNFSTAMSDNDYSVVSDGRYNTGDTAGSSICSIRREALTTSKFGVRGSNPEAQTFSDFEMVSAIVFGN